MNPQILFGGFICLAACFFGWNFWHGLRFGKVLQFDNGPKTQFIRRSEGLFYYVYWIGSLLIFVAGMLFGVLAILH